MNISFSIKNKFSWLKDYNFYRLFLVSIVFFLSLISYENITFNLYFNRIYSEYGRFFVNFDWNVFSHPKTTFPIWGYGIIHFLGLTKLTVLIIQQFFTVYTLLKLDKLLTKYKLISKIELFRFIILLSSTWFLFHTQMWPKSVAGNLFILGCVFSIEFIKSKKEIYLLYSSIIFGIMHNFRPDYFYLSLVLYIIYIYYCRNDLNWKKFTFPLIQYFLLIPWMMFTYHQTGKFIPTSTNAGHVLFIGLGQLPENKWGITPLDDDPVKTKILRDEFGSNFKSDDYEEDTFLKKKFIEYVKNDPIEYLKKCFFSIRLLILDPFYVGNVGSFQMSEISNIDEIRRLETLIYRFKFKDSYKLITNTKWVFSSKEIFQLLITIYTKVFGIFIFMAFLFISIYALIKDNFFKYPNPIIILLYIIIGYQISISIFAFHMPVYNSISYIFYVLLTYLLFQKYLSIKQ
jgi:hypothetical protein